MRTMSDASRPVIRRAVPADGPALADIELRTWSPLHAVVPAPDPARESVFDDRHLPEQDLVAERTADHVLLGYIRVVPPTNLRCNAHVRQIQGLVVDTPARGLGVARALVEAACEEAWSQGALRITLRVLGHNVPARRLYASCGFEIEGVLPGEFLLDGAYVDDVLMGRRLPGSAAGDRPRVSP